MLTFAPVPASDAPGPDEACTQDGFTQQAAWEARTPRALAAADRHASPARILGIALTLWLHSLVLLLATAGFEPLTSERVLLELPADESRRDAIEVSFVAPSPQPIAKPEPPKPQPALRRTEPVRAMNTPPVPPPAEPVAVVEPDPAPVRVESVATTVPQPVESVPAPVPPESVSEPPSVAPSQPSPPLSAKAKRAQSNYVRELMAWLLRYRVYPDAARKDKAQGTVLVSFSIDRAGRVRSARIARSSGIAALDQAALQVLSAASPVPAIPDSLGRDRLSINLPIEYSLITD